MLASMDETAVLFATETLGELGDVEAVPELIELLEPADTAISKAAYRALCGTTGRRLRHDLGAWEGWYLSELTWLRRDLPVLARALHGDDARVARTAVDELAAHPLFPDELAGELVLLLDSDDVQLAGSACAALGRLHARAAVPALVEVLDDRHADPATHVAARDALQQITGLELPLDAALWRRRLSRTGELP